MVTGGGGGGVGLGAGFGVGLGLGLGVGFGVVAVAFGVAFGVVRDDVDGDGDGRGTAATVRVSAVGVLVDEVGNGLVCTDVGVAVVGVAGVLGARSASSGGFTGGVASSRPHAETSPTVASTDTDAAAYARARRRITNERNTATSRVTTPRVPAGDESPKCPVPECGPLSPDAHPAAPPHPAPTGHHARRCRAADVGWTTR